MAYMHSLWRTYRPVGPLTKNAKSYHYGDRKRLLKIRQKSISGPIALKFGSFVEPLGAPNRAKFHAAASPPSGDIKP